jgi:PIN domain nuclease of toxin-antitoxin system
MISLLDSYVILWAAREPNRLSTRVRDLLLNPQQELLFSVVSAWEIALKPELGIADATRWFRQAARKLQARILPVRLEHIAALQKLPLRHRDPFDRLLIAQAVAGELALVTADQAIRSYPEVRCVWD